MKKFRKHLLIGMTALTLGAGSFAAYANQPACDAHGWHHGSAADHAKFVERMKARIAKREAELHTQLKLNPSQEAAWNAYIAKMQPEAPPQRPSRAEIDKLSVPERMQKRLDMMKQHEDKMAQRVAATRDFYATLSPEQQKVFNDAFHRRPHHRHGEHRGEHRGEPGGQQPQSR